MLEFLAMTALVVSLVVGLLGVLAWRVVRRVLRSRLVTTGTQMVADGVLTLAACRPRPVPNRVAALHAVRVSRGHRLLRQRVAEAQRAGAYLGDVPSVLPRLEAEGRRIREGLGRLVGSAATGHDLYSQADSHLRTLADLTEAVSGAMTVPGADETLARDAEEAALGLRLHAAAYSELMSPLTARTGDGVSVPPRAQAS
jgi:hypothetical protein